VPVGPPILVKNPDLTPYPATGPGQRWSSGGGSVVAGGGGLEREVTESPRGRTVAGEPHPVPTRNALVPPPHRGVTSGHQGRWQRKCSAKMRRVARRKRGERTSPPAPPRCWLPVGGIREENAPVCCHRLGPLTLKQTRGFTTFAALGLKPEAGTNRSSPSPAFAGLFRFHGLEWMNSKEPRLVRGLGVDELVQPRVSTRGLQGPPTWFQPEGCKLRHARPR
jgi:hypothetical protein